mmetsp:Transcript_43036/g.71532  ORF Transcript_43036/g.71532 Transcript_43036/m.71532 type:complete len:146 (-) Transcript_43036:139-576(-)|eukprot:CAMPEP_0119330634 /NCGR_PEP_ID=MMETSP1333-20130426/78652_1 /TAXON_ID=418940 /ORGANISM="Scyphosphaera apsteinii, Strain RCC1455" /LENGTH=145 /DNA_ID=CAMNT_0007340039 /DNA_START=100 /DNA_END=537 /DNA_ORIENTATION=-
MESLRREDIEGLRTVFDAFDHNQDGLLDVDEVSAVAGHLGLSMSDAEVLDIVTEVKPVLRKLPFEEFVAFVCRPMPGDQITDEVRATFSTFAGSEQSVDAASLKQAMTDLGHPVSMLMSEEMIREADLDHDGKVNAADFMKAMVT